MNLWPLLQRIIGRQRRQLTDAEITRLSQDSDQFEETFAWKDSRVVYEDE